MDYANQESSSTGDFGLDVTQIPVHETSSGTIMINNQSIIVTIENGILTLSTSPEGYAYKEDGLTKKGSVVKYRCPNPGCSSTFDTRQKLKIHLVLHTEDQRPFKCTVEGCDWSFTTLYKLKRHLQSHDKVRPYKCEWENCGLRFTTVYNLKAHVKAHNLENAFICEVVCSERFHTATRLTNHQRTHYEPERPHKCEFPGCEKTFITFSALFSHNRTHFREMAQFTCTYPGCDKRYDKACRLQIHLCSHTGEQISIYLDQWRSQGRGHGGTGPS
ncbi:LOW QUALITY PROTEIN: zinc finger protein ZXDC-like [Carassius auratus]|uniref:LOW QUALITY PROTEIN: zinc finger protein ZXDC-like n=1 Tax=Carassius auratus TaxID=7957 RepID=A0A6P6PCP2_CARAU|nr:LOW QUALITY PROTEIN: zinc finger protein ZXDC-like [Carassius auratus]